MDRAGVRGWERDEGCVPGPGHRRCYWSVAAQRAAGSRLWLRPRDLPLAPGPVLAGAARGHGGSAGTGAQHRGANTRHAWTRGGCRLSCRRARLVRAELPALRAPGVRRAGTAPRVFSTLFYYKDRLFQESATSTTQQVRALHPQHVSKFKNMLQRARGFQTALQTLKLLLC